MGFQFAHDRYSQKHATYYWYGEYFIVEFALTGDEFCEPYVNIPLTDNLLDNGPNSKSVMSRGVQLVDLPGERGRSAEFKGNGKITVMALNNMDFLSSFALAFRFRSSEEMVQGNYALIDNSDCNKNATFGVALVKGSQNRETIVGGFILTDGSFIRTDGITVVRLVENKK